jgi:hypothetical protein
MEIVDGDLGLELTQGRASRPVIVVKMEFRTVRGHSSSIMVELDKERACTRSGMISERINGCFSSLANEIKDWLCERLPNLNNLLS